MVHGFIVRPGSAPSAAFCSVVGGTADLGKRTKRKRHAGWQSCETRAVLISSDRLHYITEVTKMKMNLQFVGNISLRDYGIFLGDSGIESAMISALSENGLINQDIIGTVKIEIDSIKNPGMQVVVEK